MDHQQKTKSLPKNRQKQLLATNYWEKTILHFESKSGSRKFCQRGSNFDVVFFFIVDEGWEDPNTTISGPSSACQRNAISMAFRWHADDGPTLNAGLVAL